MNACDVFGSSDNFHQSAVVQLCSYAVVVARYKEDLAWLNKFDLDKVIIYNKGGPIKIPTSFAKTPVIYSLPNVGRESHTYLTFIIDYYENLPEVVHFTQGAIHDHVYYKDIDFLDIPKGYSESYAINTPCQYLNDDCRLSSCRHQPTEPSPYNCITWARMFVDETLERDTLIPIFWNGIFSVRKKYILSRSKEYYQTLIKHLEGSSNPEVGHCFERSWFLIFNCGK